MKKHTSGPWVWYDHDHLIQTTSSGVGEVILEVKLGLHPKREDAALIAAAPAMFSALETALFIYEQNGFDDHAAAVRNLLSEINERAKK